MSFSLELLYLFFDSPSSDFFFPSANSPRAFLRKAREDSPACFSLNFPEYAFEIFLFPLPPLAKRARSASPQDKGGFSLHACSVKGFSFRCCPQRFSFLCFSSRAHHETPHLSSFKTSSHLRFLFSGLFSNPPPFFPLKSPLWDGDLPQLLFVLSRASYRSLPSVLWPPGPEVSGLRVSEKSFEREVGKPLTLEFLARDVHYLFPLFRLPPPKGPGRIVLPWKDCLFEAASRFR